MVLDFLPATSIAMARQVDRRCAALIASRSAVTRAFVDGENARLATAIPSYKGLTIEQAARLHFKVNGMGGEKTWHRSCLSIAWKYGQDNDVHPTDPLYLPSLLEAFLYISDLANYSHEDLQESEPHCASWIGLEMLNATADGRESWWAGSQRDFLADAGARNAAHSISFTHWIEMARNVRARPINARVFTEPAKEELEGAFWGTMDLAHAHVRNLYSTAEMVSKRRAVVQQLGLKHPGSGVRLVATAKGVRYAKVWNEGGRTDGVLGAAICGQIVWTEVFARYHKLKF